MNITTKPSRDDIAKAIYQAKKKNAWGKMVSEYNKPFPKDKKEMRSRMYGDEDCGLSFAFSQADAVIKLLETANNG